MAKIRFCSIYFSCRSTPFTATIYF